MSELAISSKSFVLCICTTHRLPEGNTAEFVIGIADNFQYKIYNLFKCKGVYTCICGFNKLKFC